MQNVSRTELPVSGAHLLVALGDLLLPALQPVCSTLLQGTLPDLSRAALAAGCTMLVQEAAAQAAFDKLKAGRPCAPFLLISERCLDATRML